MVVPPVATSKKIDLPHDQDVKLFVIMQASLLSILKIHTKDAYALEVANAANVSLSRQSRDLEGAAARQLGTRQDIYSTLEDVPRASSIRRPPNWLVAFILLGCTVATIGYFQYNKTAMAQVIAMWNSYSLTIIISAVIVLALLMYLFMVRKRRPKM